jgi:hypothetical protein
MENGEFSHETMVIFHSYVNAYQRVSNNRGGFHPTWGWDGRFDSILANHKWDVEKGFPGHYPEEILGFGQKSLEVDPPKVMFVGF